jgi:hypothetical protein
VTGRGLVIGVALSLVLWGLLLLIGSDMALLIGAVR